MDSSNWIFFRKMHTLYFFTQFEFHDHTLFSILVNNFSSFSSSHCIIDFPFMLQKKQNVCWQNTIKRSRCQMKKHKKRQVTRIFSLVCNFYNLRMEFTKFTDLLYYLRCAIFFLGQRNISSVPAICRVMMSNLISKIEGTALHIQFKRFVFAPQYSRLFNVDSVNDAPIHERIIISIQEICSSTSTLREAYKSDHSEKGKCRLFTCFIVILLQCLSIQNRWPVFLCSTYQRI